MELQGRSTITSAEPPAPSSYLPGLDGLRALSVIAVLAYHANSSWLPGGFLGVEVFFVISGFIITRSLVLEWQQKGGISAPGFWLRRARRLLPALFITLGGVTAYTALFDSSLLAGLREDVLFALGYVTNWHLIFSGQSYFDSWNQPSVLRHLWSLAIEEQFYLAWPLVLLGSLRLFRAGGTAFLVLAGAVGSYAAMAVLSGGADGNDRVYFGTDTRVGSLLAGSFLGLLPLAPALAGKIESSRVVAFAGVIALGQLCLFAWQFSDSGTFIYRGGFALTSLMAALVVLSVTNPRSLPSRFLGLMPLRWIGVRSYGIYLYHWPILLLSWPDLSGPWSTLLLQLGATLLIADLSYRFIELPVRRGVLARAYRSLTEQRAGWRQGFAAGFAGASLSIATAALVFVAIDAKAPSPEPYQALTQLRLVSPSAAQDVSSSVSTITPPQEQPADLPAADPPPPEIDIPGRCAEIRGRVYESDEERQWFLANCLNQQAPQPARQTEGTETPSPPPPPLPTFVATGTISVEGGISAIGDSVMVGAGGWLASTFAGIDIDAAVGRQVSQAVALLSQRAAEGSLGQTVVLHLGNNGTLSSAQFDQVMAAIGPGRRVFFITLHVPRPWEESNNAAIREGVARYPNAGLIEWQGVVAGHDELFASDGVHVGPAGARLYADLVAAAVAR